MDRDGSEITRRDSTGKSEEVFFQHTALCNEVTQRRVASAFGTAAGGMLWEDVPRRCAWNRRSRRQTRMSLAGDASDGGEYWRLAAAPRRLASLAASASDAPRLCVCFRVDQRRTGLWAAGRRELSRLRICDCGLRIGREGQGRRCFKPQSAIIDPRCIL